MTDPPSTDEGSNLVLKTAGDHSSVLGFHNVLL
jgi:hypothetical protein